MANSTRDSDSFTADPASAPPLIGSPWEMVRTALAPVASLRLTVVLFALSIFLVFTGTLAQQYMDIWEIVDGYFRAPIAWIEFRVFAFFFGGNLPLAELERVKFPFPGGITIGLALAVNLFSAHLVRFKTQARGGRLIVGLFVTMLGAGVTWAVISSGSLEQVVDSAAGEVALTGATMQWSLLWLAIKIALFLLLLTTAGAATYLYQTREQHQRRAEMYIAAVSAAIIAPLLSWIVLRGDEFVLGDSSMRILWQLIKGEFAALVLLAGCMLAFNRRAGIVLIHSGVALMMVNEFVVYSLHTEASMMLAEGQAANYVQDIRAFELAVVDRSDDEIDQVVVVPGSRITPDDDPDEPLPFVSDEKLPFDIQVVEFFKNSRLRRPAQGDTNLATVGVGRSWIAEPVRGGTGTDMDSGVDQTSAYIQLQRKDSDEQQSDDLGIFLVSHVLNPEEIEVDGKKYWISLRHKRIYKSYCIALVDVRADNYMGTQTTRNFSSDIRLVDPTRDVDRKVHIRMNNPMRFAGETFYQQNYQNIGGREITTLQVVSNTGWMIPYVACMIVGTGMLAQFLVVLLRFLNRRDKEQSEVVVAELIDEQSGWLPLVARWFPLAVTLVMAAYLGSKAIPPRTPAEQVNIHQFGKLPIMYEGRMKPLDTLARNSLMIISGKQTFEDDSEDEQPAIRWLLDVMTESPRAMKHKVFRIENLEVLQDLLGLERRKGFRYGLGEFVDKLPDLGKASDDAFGKDEAKRTLFDRKVMEIANKLRMYQQLSESLNLPRMAPDVQSEVHAILSSQAARRKLADSVVPRLLPPEKDEFDWETGASAGTRNWLKLRAKDRGNTTVDGLASDIAQRYAASLAEGRRKPLTPQEVANVTRNLTIAIGELLVVTDAQGKVVGMAKLDDEVDPLAFSMMTIYEAYIEENVAKFNDEVTNYRELLQANESSAPMTSSSLLGRMFTPVTDFEAAFNNAAPFYYCAVVYLMAFILAAMAWLGWTQPLNKASLWLIALALVVHTLAIVGRIYISGRPPVTNLYSSAVFIGWAAVVLGLVFELIYKNGIGNVVAGVIGFGVLLIAHFLAADGQDTLKVLVAVLDTQFWLATHVVCVTLGYTTTIVAGILGIIYILRGVLTPSLNQAMDKDVTRMIYGTLCFAMLFSFIGTVLGGLWADDSWGRFWGWDPKENGALIIVLWNALVLHSRWGGIVRNRGLAVLAVLGITTTGWSWFGVNELGVGLHSYGFTDGVLLWLGLLGVLLPIIVVAIGLLPQRMWVSFVEQQRIKEAIAFQRGKGRS